MNELIWRRFVVGVVVIATAVVFMLPYRGVLLGGRPLPIHLRGWTSPSKRIVDDIVTGHYHLLDSYISPYDELFREVAIPDDLSWQFVCAMAYVESRFDPFAESASGAIGLMQIMPRIGRSFGVDAEDLYDPEVNVRVAVRHILDIERMLDLPSNITSRDRFCLILACYNGGIGRVFDAQRLVRLKGGDPHRWLDVALSLLDLRREEVYNSEAVKFGSFKMAHYTVGYVRDVMNKYNEYLDKTSTSSYHLYPHALRYVK